ncbi:MAG: hypothetical protein IPM82_05400 [Saprospiraceae bacterium]|nr:hypothetical protein [Saprospiraceae bacterium]
MKIEETINKIEKWVKENNIDLLHGVVDANKSATIICDTYATSIEDF